MLRENMNELDALFTSKMEMFEISLSSPRQGSAVFSSEFHTLKLFYIESRPWS